MERTNYLSSKMKAFEKHKIYYDELMANPKQYENCKELSVLGDMTIEENQLKLKELASGLLNSRTIELYIECMKVKTSDPIFAYFTETGIDSPDHSTARTEFIQPIFELIVKMSLVKIEMLYHKLDELNFSDNNLISSPVDAVEMLEKEIEIQDEINTCEFQLDHAHDVVNIVSASGGTCTIL